MGKQAYKYKIKKKKKKKERWATMGVWFVFLNNNF